MIPTKKHADREPALQILLTNNALGLGIATIAVISFWAPPKVAQWVALTGIGMPMAVAQTCFVNAVARANASLATPFSDVTLIFATLYDLIIFDAIANAISILGAIIILTGATLLAWAENRQSA